MGKEKAPAIKIYTCYSDKDHEEFTRLKKRKWDRWVFLVSGEWSESPYHQGKNTFYAGSTTSGKYWALKSHGFPTRIIAVAQVQGKVRLEKVAGQMMRAVCDQGGDYIEYFHQVGDIDEGLLRSAYDAGDDEDDEEDESGDD